MPDREDALTAHLGECASCRADVAEVPEIVAILRVGVLEENGSAPALPMLRTELQRRARASLGRRVAFAACLGAIPLPIVLAYNAVVMRIVYEVVRRFLPSEIAAYIVLSHGALLLLVIALSYAAIPFLVYNPRRMPASIHMGVTG